MSKKPPPSWIDKFLQWRLPGEQFEEVQGDMQELYSHWVAEMGEKKARRRYLWSALTFLRPLPKSKQYSYYNSKAQLYNQAHPVNMLYNYFIVAIRNLIRHKAFSFINLVGLSVSMSVGLLMITLLSDTFSYDGFHQKKDRIYRVITRDQFPGQPPMNLASTSVKAGKQIMETMSGIEATTLLRRGFNGDAKVGEKTVPLSGLWASESLFSVFTFPLLQGDPATALEEPYSLVLTEKSARKLFGRADVLGRMVQFDTLNYVVTGVMKDIPKLSHMQFEALVSFATVELQKPDFDGGFLQWENIYMNYVYVLLPEKGDAQTLQANLTKLSAAENALIENRKITLSLQPLQEIAVGERLANPIGPTFINPVARWVLGGLTFIVILSACFNYTNLSIARSLRRSREVSIRKVVGALRSQVLLQFIAEAVVMALVALVFSFLLFLVLRIEFLSLAPQVNDLFLLNLSPELIVYFVALALMVGITAGLLPALFFSRINAIQVLKNASSLKLFRHIAMRKALIVLQYTFSLIFITSTIIGYNQYRSFLTFDLGFNTENILNIRLQGNKSGLLKNELATLPAVQEISTSRIITSLGNLYGTQMKYKDPADSASVWLNFVDEHYLPLHQHTFIAGRNFSAQPKNGEESEVIVNEQLLRRFNIAGRDPQKALGEILTVEGKKLIIAGVLKDFHYGTVEHKIEPTVFRYTADEPGGYLNVKIRSGDLAATMASIRDAWRKIDRVHPLEASFYEEQIQQAYSQFSVMIRIIGFLGFLAICIASLGLFGMVVYTTETRLKEVSIRKVMGASETALVYLLSKGFLFLLGIAALIALPLTYLFFSQVILVNFAYHQPIGLSELLLGVGIIMLLAMIMIGSQTLKAARHNPVKSLRNE
jgi:putative ABC transport system permease protein